MLSSDINTRFLANHTLVFLYQQIQGFPNLQYNENISSSSEDSEFNNYYKFLIDNINEITIDSSTNSDNPLNEILKHFKTAINAEREINILVKNLKDINTKDKFESHIQTSNNLNTQLSSLKQVLSDAKQKLSFWDKFISRLFHTENYKQYAAIKSSVQQLDIKVKQTYSTAANNSSLGILARLNSARLAEDSKISLGLYKQQQQQLLNQLHEVEENMEILKSKEKIRCSQNNDAASSQFVSLLTALDKKTVKIQLQSLIQSALERFPNENEKNVISLYLKDQYNKMRNIINRYGGDNNDYIKAKESIALSTIDSSITDDDLALFLSKNDHNRIKQYLTPIVNVEKANNQAYTHVDALKAYLKDKYTRREDRLDPTFTSIYVNNQLTSTINGIFQNTYDADYSRYFKLTLEKLAYEQRLDQLGFPIPIAKKKPQTTPLSSSQSEISPSVDSVNIVLTKAYTFLLEDMTRQLIERRNKNILQAVGSGTYSASENELRKQAESILSSTYKITAPKV
ncbi:MAG: hypothetical protein KIT27_05275 [Legionellales bacterium]|nr:hypothetical protein [Legionellales bacterium]